MCLSSMVVQSKINQMLEINYCWSATYVAPENTPALLFSVGLFYIYQLVRLVKASVWGFTESGFFSEHI